MQLGRVRKVDEEGFRKFLKRGGRSPRAVKRAIAYVTEFEQYLQKQRGRKGLDEACPEDLEAFVSWFEEKHNESAKLYLWGICYYYEYTSNKEMRERAGELRGKRIEEASFALKEFRGVSPDHVKKLADVGIRNVKQMLEAGRTSDRRKELAAKTGVPAEAVLEFVKLSDLARIQGVKSIRARLYYDAGVNTIEKLAKWDAKELRAMLIKFVEKTGFEGIAPLPKEAESTVAEAKRLPKIVDY
jgi:predicted flap endonuclease-1-like 5' DNA nuclease